MKQLICLILALALCQPFAALAGENGDILIDYSELGFQLRLPEEFNNLKGIISILYAGKTGGEPDVALFVADYVCLSMEEYNANAKSDDLTVQMRNYDMSMPFITLLAAKSGVSAEEIADSLQGALGGSALAVQAEVDGYTFYAVRDYGAPQVPDAAYAEEYAQIMGNLGAILDGFDYFAPVDPYAQKMGTALSFQTADLDGHPVDSAELFGRHEYTLLNIWATWCPPCVGELAELEALNNRLAAVDCGVVGLLTDGALQTAKELLAEKGASYPCIQVPDGIYDMLFFTSIPTTYFVDRGGVIVGQAIVGAYPDVYEATVMNLLNEKREDAIQPVGEEKPVYTVRVVDQNDDPVPEAAVGFCLDTGCIPVETDEYGVAVYSGNPGRYHLQVVDAPDAYDYPNDTDVYIGPESGEATLVVTKE